MMDRQRIFLVGPMGVGKTAVGKKLASALKCDFFDSDKEIEKRTGASVGWIFDVEGEEGFRRREKSMIDELTQLDNVVLATGGGVVLNQDNRAFLKERGTVVLLMASVETLMGRTERDKSRPLLQNGNRESIITNLLTQRLPLYEEVADITIYTDQGGLKTTVQSIVKAIGPHSTQSE